MQSDSSSSVTLARRREWTRQFTQALVALGAIHQAFVLASAYRTGYGVVEATLTVLYVGLVALNAAGTSPRLLGSYIVVALGAAEWTSLVDGGFGGLSALIACELPFVAAILFGGRLPYLVIAGGLAAFSIVGALRVHGGILPDLDARRLDGNGWAPVGLALVFLALVAPLVWLVGHVTGQLRDVLAEVDRARNVHAAQVALRVAAQQALEASLVRRDRARQDAAAGMVVGGVVHDLRNSLNVLQISAGLLRVDSGRDPTVSAAANRIEAACAQAARVTEQVLSLARPHARMAECEIQPPVEAAVDMLRRSLPEDVRVVLDCTIDPTLVVSLDPSTLTSAILGLAASARLDGDRTSEIRIRVRAPSAAEQASLENVAGVVELLFSKPSSTLLDPSLGEEITRQGALVLFDAEPARARAPQSARLLLPGTPWGSPPPPPTGERPP